MEPADPDPTRRFSDRAADYARYRPGYPAAAIDAILDRLPPPARLSIADVGAGTGISARLFADRGCRVLAVEPNAAMRAVAAPHPRVQWLAGTAEQTGVDGGSCDVVVAAQAFHWFAEALALAEFARILRPRGRLAIVWNRRSRSDAFTLGYRRALEAIDGDAPAERSAFDAAAIAGSGRFTAVRREVFGNAQALDEGQLLGRALSTSTVPRRGPDTERLLAMLRELHARHRGADGRASLVYDTEVYLCERTG